MLRVAAWTGGLFAVGGSVAHFFPGPVTEPLVLLALGSALFLVAGRSAPAASAAASSGPDAASSTRAAR